MRRITIPAAIVAAVIIAAVLTLPGCGTVYAASNAAAEDNAARNITESCFFSILPDENGYTAGTGALCDNDLDTYMRLPESAPPYWDVSVRSASAQGFYIQWEYAPDVWTFTARDEKGAVLLSEQRGGTGYIQEYVPLPRGTRSFRIAQPEDCERPLSVLEISVWSDGILPDSVHRWEPTPSQCELMVISAHQDDELLFFGGVIPYYTCGRQLDTVVVYMANCGSKRLHEALNGLWVCGARQYPVFAMLPDVKSTSLTIAQLTWDEDEITDIIARLFLQYRPQVVVTHDINGEYGHGQHMLTARCTQCALAACEDREQAERLLPGAEPYMVPKCYLHLWEHNEVVMDWGSLYIDRLGMSAADAASAGYEQHISQHRWYEGVFFGGEYDCARFGLYHTHTGTDIRRDDLFENITPRIEAPESIPEPPGGFSPLLRGGLICSGTESGDKTIYIRYGTAEGAEDWYLCDRTGALSTVGGKPVRYRNDIFKVISDVIASDYSGDTDGGSYVSRLLGSRLYGILSALTGGETEYALAALCVFFAAVIIIFILLLSAAVRKRRDPSRKTDR